ncbi:PucR family transcriptional regulator [Streptomyces sp. NBC_01795]|uniref:PucR family transcriptional regulator n=1 Tax=unclassified Streptomyces TaxID=2593676 RepID=UPI002DDBC505|nr:MULTISPECIES: PucR family transcriptional regulator [unclassified Streptomyces]WSA92067.1 PucR family transcriptional regulator [Streptomyces sp. NBC_01795]WSS15292.1 PucR family transcriptional regulator [Streptomyces sp. NBC_01186]
MPPTLATLVQHSALRLSVLAGHDRLDAPVRWAHASELADPTPYMDGGELILFTGLKLDAADPEAMHAYVDKLVGKDVVGLGFAAGVNYEGVPKALTDACESAGLPLLEVPRRTPFIAISKAVSAAIAAEQYRAVTAGFDAQREMTRAALSREGPAALLARLASQVDGWAALYDASGAVVATAPSWAVRRASRFIGDAVRLRDRPTPASALVSESDSGDDRVELQSVGSGRRAKAVLAVGTAAPLGTAERYAVHSAIALLTLTTERSRALQEAEQRLGAAVLKMLLVGEGDHARAVSGQLYGGLLDAPMRVIVAEPASGAAVRVAQESVLATHAARTRTGSASQSGSASKSGSAAWTGSAAPAPESGSTIDQSGAAVGSRPGAASGSRGGSASRQSPGPGSASSSGSGSGDESRATAGVVVGSGSGPQTDPADGGAPGRAVWPLEELSDAMETAAARNGEAVLVVPDGARLVVLASDGGAAVAACGEFAATNPLAQPGRRGSGAGEEGLAIGVSAPIGLPAAAVAFKQADQALSVARRRGVPLVEHEDVAAGSVLPLLADDAVRAFADGLLRALREHDANGRGDLVASLRAWLSRHGQWDAAAAELGVHRHTLRYRMRRVEEILGRSLDDPDVRMELWLALKATS